MAEEYSKAVERVKPSGLELTDRLEREQTFSDEDADKIKEYLTQYKESRKA